MAVPGRGKSKSLVPFSCKLDEMGFGEIKIGDFVLPNTTSLEVKADMDSVATATIGLFPEAPVELILPAQVTVNIMAVEGEIIKTPLENGQVSYKVIRQVPMFPPGT